MGCLRGASALFERITKIKGVFKRGVSPRYTIREFKRDEVPLQKKSSPSP
jgi:hypothetical protein